MKIITFTLMLLTMSVEVEANDKTILLFGTQNQIFTNINRLENADYVVKHYHIDGGRLFEKEISANLSNNPKIALRQAKANFKEYKSLWAAKGKRSWQGVINAQSLNITKVPAITFDNGKTVIYGVLGLSNAYRIWDNYVNSK